MQEIQKAVCATLQWYQDQGVTDVLSDSPVNRFLAQDIAPLPLPVFEAPAARRDSGVVAPASAPVVLPRPSELLQEAAALAQGAGDLSALSEVIAGFEGLGLKKTATRFVFADGNPQARVMVIGDAPAAEDDREGKAFQGENGALLDKILGAIGLSRTAEDPAQAVYLTNVLNWRPPGGRSLSPAELEMSVPFIQRHIALVRPEILVLCGGVTAKALLGATENLSKLRKNWHMYEGAAGEEPFAIPALVTYHPAYLLSTPSQKKAVWADMLTLDKKRREIVTKK